MKITNAYWVYERFVTPEFREKTCKKQWIHNFYTIFKGWTQYIHNLKVFHYVELLFLAFRIKLYLRISNSHLGQGDLHRLVSESQRLSLNTHKWPNILYSDFPLYATYIFFQSNKQHSHRTHEGVSTTCRVLPGLIYWIGTSRFYVVSFLLAWTLLRFVLRISRELNLVPITSQGILLHTCVPNIWIKYSFHWDSSTAYANTLVKIIKRQFLHA